jgi:undecaprenyl diphosphate synthase
MTPSALRHATPAGLHVAIIMDGNGRWATARAMPRSAGHRQGAESVRRVVKAAPGLGIGTLTLYAFSSDNWRRPPREVALLMRLFRAHLRSETPELVKNGVRLSVIGRRDRLALSLRAAIAEAEDKTAQGSRLHLRLAIDYSARDAIVTAAALARDGAELSRDAFRALLARAYDSDAGAPDVDLLVRTGAEQRLSDFMLWECAYAELAFRREMWPEFDEACLAAAVAEFHSRQRRFGALPGARSA